MLEGLRCGSLRIDAKSCKTTNCAKSEIDRRSRGSWSILCDKVLSIYITAMVAHHKFLPPGNEQTLTLCEKVRCTDFLLT